VEGGEKFQSNQIKQNAMNATLSQNVEGMGYHIS
jgi:hypothetical protein